MEKGVNEITFGQKVLNNDINDYHFNVFKASRNHASAETDVYY